MLPERGTQGAHYNLSPRRKSPERSRRESPCRGAYNPIGFFAGRSGHFGAVQKFRVGASIELRPRQRPEIQLHAGKMDHLEPSRSRRP
jgi:hypothetical protein